MKTGHVAVLAAVAFFIEPTAAGLIAVKGTGPDLMLCVTIAAVCFCREPAPVIGIMAVTAVLRDICFALYTGPGAMAVFFTGVCAVAAVKYCAWDKPAFFLVFTVLETILYKTVLWAGMRLLGAPWSFFHFVQVLPVSLFYNLAIMFLVCRKWLKTEKERYYT